MTGRSKPESQVPMRSWFVLLALLSLTAARADEGAPAGRFAPSGAMTGRAETARPRIPSPRPMVLAPAPAQTAPNGERNDLSAGRPALNDTSLADWMSTLGAGPRVDWSSPQPSAVGAGAPSNSPTVAPRGPAPERPSGAGQAPLFLEPADPAQAAVPFSETQASWDDQLTQTACSTCGGYHSLADGSALHESLGCGAGQCIPGRKPCYPPANSSHTVIGTFCQNLYQCLCCPDPCYEPKWVPGANASFFADYARPRTVTRLRYDNLENMTRPDRNQFWIQGVVPTRNNSHRIRNPYARLQQFYVYQEAAGKFGSFFVEYPYRQFNQSWAPTQAGFGNVNFGIKSLMFDCELLQIASQFRTFMPTGSGSLNLGNGVFALDPSILLSLKLGSETYFQGQFGNWIPLLGNKNLAGGVFYSLMSLNHVVARPMPDCPLIATLEMDVWSFENGGYTSAIAPGKKPVYVQKGGGVSYFNIGPGLRQSVCNRLDVGAAITWATNTAHWAQPWFRFEVRFLF